MDAYNIRTEYTINNEHDLIEALRDQYVAGYEVEVKFTSVRDQDGVIWPTINITDTTDPEAVGLVGHYWFWDDGTVMQVL